MNIIRKLTLVSLVATSSFGVAGSAAAADSNRLTCSQHATHQTNQQWPSTHWTDSVAVAFSWGVHYMNCVTN